MSSRSMVLARHARCLALAGTAALLTGSIALADASLPDRTALDEYVHEPDASFEWSVVSSDTERGVTSHVLSMTSQTWREPSEVDRTKWKHWIVVARPAEVRADTALLYIGGGRNGGEPPEGPDRRIRAIALASGAVAAELRMVPNQPLRFAGDSRDRYEDDLVAYTWNQAMRTGDMTWVARMPMVKSAVRAMDALQALARTPAGGELELKKFVVAGGSKRGWTTWLTGAVDSRVAAIVPIVIDVLNVQTSMDHHFAAYGFWAPAIGDYERAGITERRGDSKYQKLLRLVDPYYYRHRLKLPKMIINATGDEFFLPDSSQFYFDDLIGEKHLRYVPNTNHSLRGSDAAGTLQAFFDMVVDGTPRPSIDWSFEDDGAIEARVVKGEPSEVRVWQATNPGARDFRLQTIGPVWTSSKLQGDDGAYVAHVEKPERGWRAFFVEMTFPTSGPSPFKLTTGVRVVPDVLPYQDKLDREAGK